MGNGYSAPCAHLVEEDGTLNVAEFDNFLKEVDLAACVLEYAVVSIMGPQSSGKSTLLNHLFGTNFKELDGVTGRSRTTRGIWLARCASIKPCTLVMDLEGSDGRERGEDDTAFEKRSSLFALAVSHVVLININSVNVGLDHGASKPLLRNVFQGISRLQLFKPHKTTLMFVLRDVSPEKSLKVLEPIVRADIQQIWDSLPNPEGHKRSPFSTHFTVDFVGLPHYEHKQKQFKWQVDVLKKWLISSIAPVVLARNRKDGIRGSEFSTSVQTIWKTIKDDEDLDLPSHMVMVADTRCKEIANKKLKAFDANEERRRLEKGAQTNPARGFGKKLSTIIKSYLLEYDKETAYFDEGIRSAKREYLEEKLGQLVLPAIHSALEQIASRVLEEFKEAFANALKKGKDFKVATENCSAACHKSFEDKYADVNVEQAKYDGHTERGKLHCDMANHVLKVHIDKPYVLPTPVQDCDIQHLLVSILKGVTYGAPAISLLLGGGQLTAGAMVGIVGCVAEEIARNIEKRQQTIPVVPLATQ